MGTTVTNTCPTNSIIYLVNRNPKSLCNARVQLFHVGEVLNLLGGAPVRQLTVENQLSSRRDSALPRGGRAVVVVGGQRGKRGRGSLLFCTSPAPARARFGSFFRTSLATRLLLSTEYRHARTEQPSLCDRICSNGENEVLRPQHQRRDGGPCRATCCYGILQNTVRAAKVIS